MLYALAPKHQPKCIGGITGLIKRKTKKYRNNCRSLTINDLIFSFGQSFSRNKDDFIQIFKKLNRLDELGCHGFYYDSHAKFMFSAKSENERGKLRSSFFLHAYQQKELLKLQLNNTNS